MKRHSDTSIIPKIILFLVTVSIVGIILLFLRARPHGPKRAKSPETPEKLFTQVIEASLPKILELWEDADRFVPTDGLNCPSEIAPDKNVGKSYFQCNPHFWQCYWQGGVQDKVEIEIDLFGQTYHLRALANFSGRYSEAFHRQNPGVPLSTGQVVEFEIKELPGRTQSLLLGDTCRDTYLPQRIYGQGKVTDPMKDGFIWDNFGRHIFIDKFYVSNQKLNVWYELSGQSDKKITDVVNWPKPALINLSEQTSYCAFFGKRLLEAKLFDAATMTPADLKNPKPLKVYRPQTPWQRDLSKSFLGMARINPDYQLTPLDCQLAQVQGCYEKYFTTDSATWMGFYYALGFYPESLQNFIEPKLNLKKSSKFLDPASTWHELGVLGSWDGKQSPREQVAFRCYEEVSL